MLTTNKAKKFQFFSALFLKRSLKLVTIIQITYDNESEVITGKSQTEALMYLASDGKVNTSRMRSEISL